MEAAGMRASEAVGGPALALRICRVFDAFLLTNLPATRLFVGSGIASNLAGLCACPVIGAFGVHR